MKSTHSNLILDTTDVEEGLDLLPQLPPGPGAELEVFAQVALDNLEGDPTQRINCQLKSCNTLKFPK